MSDPQTAADPELVEALAEIARLHAELRVVGDNLTSVQTRCTELLNETRAQRVELGELRVELDEANALKEAFGQKAHQLQQRVVEPEVGGLVLPGWDCRACGAFNGSAKEQLKACRCCGARPA